MCFVSNRYDVVCLDTQGFRDRDNDGPYVEEPIEDQDEAEVIWRFDLINKLSVFPFGRLNRPATCIDRPKNSRANDKRVSNPAQPRAAWMGFVAAM